VSLAVLFCGYRERSGIAAGVAFSRPHAESHNLNLTFDVGQRFPYIPNPFECRATLPLQGEELVVMERNGIPLCYVINEDCQKDSRCPSLQSGISCWSINDVSCCRRNDKSRCIYCSVYVSFLHWKETGDLRPGRSRKPSGTTASSG
jgi:hypothetical protein